jgi:type I restriction enzyme R subunit
MSSSSNFFFLTSHDGRLVEAGSSAERALGMGDAVGALVHLRRLGELLARNAAASLGLFDGRDVDQAQRIQSLARRGIDGEIIELFHLLRKRGNAAAHDGLGTQTEAFQCLKVGRQLALWFHRTVTRSPTFNPGPFVPPKNWVAETEELRKEVAALNEESEAREAERDEAQEAAEEEARKRLGAEEAARREREQREFFEAYAVEQEAERVRNEQALAEARRRIAELEAAQEAALRAASAAAEAATPAAAEDVLQSSHRAASALELDEAATRELIDAQLERAGWQADTQNLRFSKGARPRKGANLAIAEWPTESGPADYVLFVGLEAVGVVEAKKKSRDVGAALTQAKRYSEGLRFEGEATAAGGPWGKYRVPFLFATNGRPYLEQLRDKSGIHFLDARRSTNLATALPGWRTPENLKASLRQDIDEANQRLEAEPTDYLGLRDYQIAAIRAVERAVAAEQRTALVAMATGTGKTRTAIGLVYRLLKAGRFRRVLFLVDRTALGQQTDDAFGEARLEGLKTFKEIYDLKGLEDLRPDTTTKLHIATVQGMVRRIFDAADPSDLPAVDDYDCVVIDECHRGYGLDQELSDTELRLSEYGIRSQADYISKYRRVLDHFDAVKIGLTATPAAHTTQIFGPPTFRYTYREAVIDGNLVDHEPPVSLVTQLAESGIHWSRGEQVQLFDPEQMGIDKIHLPDEVDVEIDSFNKTVITENFNRVVCVELARHIDPTDTGKTLVFCATDHHADMVVRLLKDAFQEQYGEIEDDAVMKITGRSDRPLHLIRRYKNDRLPSVGVTVDLLTTGIDVPAITNLVFLRRVKSRILYEQMLGRATRKCDEIGKSAFRIFDAVALYEALEPVTDMKAVVSRPNISFRQLVEELERVEDPDGKQHALEELVAKLQRKRAVLRGDGLNRFQGFAGMGPGELARQLRAGTPTEAARWFRDHQHVLQLLEAESTGSRPLLVSEHEDRIVSVTRGYGKGEKPADYLDEFERWVRANINTLPSLITVAQRPRELTRQQLKELALELDAAGFTEASLQSAWRESTQQDIAAGIIGFVRRAALGDPLIPYESRVDQAVAKLLARHRFTDPQRKWLERIAKAIKQDKIMDRAAFDRGQWQSQGGYARLDKIFDGQLDSLLAELTEAMWHQEELTSA